MRRASWRKKCPLDELRLAALLKDYFAQATVQKDGQVAWSGFGSHDDQLILLGCIQFPSNLPRDLKEASIWRASNQCVKLSRKSTVDFIDLINEQIRSYFSSQTEPTIIVTKLSCARPSKDVSLKVGNYTLTIHSARPGRLDISAFSASHRVDPSVPTKYAFATLRGEGRSLSDKFEQALRELSIVCAILNLLSTYGHRTIFTTQGNGLPLKQVCFGKYFVLYEQTGKRHEERYHYLYDDELLETVMDREQLAKLLKDTRFILKRLDKHPLRDELRRALLLYQSAVEARDMDAAQMRMWSALEQLVLTSAIQNGVETVRRVSNLFDEPQIAAAKLTAVREYRNRGVHLGEEDEYGLPIVQCSKDYFHRLFIFFLKNKVGLRRSRILRSF